MISTTAAFCLLATVTASFVYALRTPSRKNSRALPGGARDPLSRPVETKGKNHA